MHSSIISEYWGGLMRAGSSVLLVSQSFDHFQNFAPRREHPAAALLVFLHRLHQLNLGIREGATASRRLRGPRRGAGGPGLGGPPRLRLPSRAGVGPSRDLVGGDGVHAGGIELA